MPSFASNQFANNNLQQSHWTNLKIIAINSKEAVEDSRYNLFAMYQKFAKPPFDLAEIAKFSWVKRVYVLLYIFLISSERLYICSLTCLQFGQDSGLWGQRFALLL